MRLLRPPLPTYEWQEVLGRGSMRAVENVETPDFVRRISISEYMRPLLRCGITRFVERIDDELETLARFCGAVVVPHEWGLTRPPQAERQRRRDEALQISQLIQPRRGYDLVAKVARINKHLEPDGWEHQIRAGLSRYAGTRRDYFYSDRKVDQFMFGTIKGSTEPTSWLVDIDLRFLPEYKHRLHYPLEANDDSF